jgi:hypothetical protein
MCVLKPKEKEKGKNKGKKVAPSNDYVIQYIEGDDEYVILFSVKENSFVKLN